MLSKLLFLFGAATSSALNSNDVDTKYFVGIFNNNEFPMAVNKCNPISLSGASYQMAVCNSETELVYNIYSDSNCTNPSDEPIIIDGSLTQTGLGSYFDFNCNPQYTDACAKIEYKISSCINTHSVVVHAALDTCVAQTGLYLSNPNVDLSNAESINLYCSSSTEAKVEYFSSPNSVTGVCSSEGPDRLDSINENCGLVSSVGGQTAFARLLECEQGEVTSTQPISTSFYATTLSPTEEPTEEPTESSIRDNDDILFGIGQGENFDDYKDYESLLGTFDITVRTIWGSRSQVFNVLKSALIDILKVEHDLFGEDNVKLFIPEFNAEIVEGKHGRSEINLLFSIRLIDTNDVDGSIISNWFDFFIRRAAVLAAEFGANCQEEALKFSLEGFGHVIVNDASLTRFDQDGRVIFSVSLGNSYNNV